MRGLLQRDPGQRFAGGDGRDDLTGAGKELPVQIFRKALQDRVLLLLGEGIEHGHKAGVAGAGDGRVSKGDLPAQLR